MTEKIATVHGSIRTIQHSIDVHLYCNDQQEQPSDQASAASTKLVMNARIELEGVSAPFFSLGLLREWVK